MNPSTADKKFLFFLSAKGLGHDQEISQILQELFPLPADATIPTFLQWKNTIFSFLHALEEEGFIKIVWWDTYGLEFGPLRVNNLPFKVRILRAGTDYLITHPKTGPGFHIEVKGKGHYVTTTGNGDISIDSHNKGAAKEKKDMAAKLKKWGLAIAGVLVAFIGVWSAFEKEIVTPIRHKSVEAVDTPTNAKKHIDSTAKKTKQTDTVKVSGKDTVSAKGPRSRPDSTSKRKNAALSKQNKIVDDSLYGLEFNRANIDKVIAVVESKRIDILITYVIRDSTQARLVEQRLHKKGYRNVTLEPMTMGPIEFDFYPPLAYRLFSNPRRHFVIYVKGTREGKNLEK